MESNENIIAALSAKFKLPTLNYNGVRELLKKARKSSINVTEEERAVLIFLCEQLIAAIRVSYSLPNAMI